MKHPQALAGDYDGYVRNTLDARYRGYTLMRYDWGAVTAVDPASYTCTATIAGVAVAGIKYGRFVPTIGKRYPVFTTKAGDRWIKVISRGALATIDQWWFINTHITGSRATGDPDFSLKVTQYAADGVTVADGLQIIQRGGTFISQLRNGATMSPAYSGPAASAITAGATTSQAGEFVLAAGTSIYRVVDPTTNTFALQGTAPFTVRFLAPHPSNNLKFYAASETGGVAVTTNGGVTWTSLTSPLTGSYVRIAGLYCVHADQLLVLLATNYDLAESQADDSNSTFNIATVGANWTSNFAGVFAWSFSANDGSSWTLCNANSTTQTREPFLAGSTSVSRVVATARIATGCAPMILEGVNFDYEASGGAERANDAYGIQGFSTQTGSSPVWAAAAFENYDLADSGPCAPNPTGVDWHRRGFGYLLSPAQMAAAAAYTGVA